MEVYIKSCKKGWIVLNENGRRMSDNVWRKYYEAEDYCIDNGWIICEYEND